MTSAVEARASAGRVGVVRGDLGGGEYVGVDGELVQAALEVVVVGVAGPTGQVLASGAPVAVEVLDRGGVRPLEHSVDVQLHVVGAGGGVGADHVVPGAVVDGAAAGHHLPGGTDSEVDLAR